MGSWKGAGATKLVACKLSRSTSDEPRPPASTAKPANFHVAATIATAAGPPNTWGGPLWW
jgi:hypothetical protein